MSVSVRFTYPLASLPNATANPLILKQEIINAGVTAPADVYREASDVVVAYSEQIADSAALDAVVLAHQGANFSAAYQDKAEADDIYLQPEFTTTSTEWQEVNAHTSGPLKAGSYQIFAAAEHRTDPEGTDESQVRVLVDLAGTMTEVCFDSRSQDTFGGWSNGLVLPVADGEELKVTIQARTTGTATAHVRRARIVHYPL